MSDAEASLDDPRDAALERFRILRPHLEDGVPLRAIARGSDVSPRTLSYWKRRYEADGLGGLQRCRREDRGTRRSISARLVELAEGLALDKPPMSVATIHRQVCAAARHLGEPEPTYRVVYNIIRALPKDLKTLAHDGPKAYGDSFELVHRREAERSNAVWQADHTRLDLLALRPDGEEGRPWLTVIMDDHSRAVAGFFLSWDAPAAAQTALALRQAIWRKVEPRWHICGIPEVLYVDNGSDFTSKHLEQAAADLKIRLVFSLPGRPRGRGRIERFFETVNQMFLSELPGYLGPGGVRDRKRLLTLTAVERRLSEFVVDVWQVRTHTETRQTPTARWEMGGFLPRMPESLERLDLLLLTVPKSRKVRPDGIHLNGFRYLDPTLAAFVGETVTIRYDPRDMGEVRVFHDGYFLCRAICPDLSGETVPLRDIVSARNRRRREMRQALRDRARTVEELLQFKRHEAREEDGPTESTEAPPCPPLPTLKRYHNE
ncbi:MAG: Mu transposase C-terminal domain-containing protein [Pseudomonadota bacterium]